MEPNNLKQSVREFWDRRSCGERYADGDGLLQQYVTQARARYALEPYILPFARFEDGADRDVLEIGVGMGADHAEWAKAGPRSLTGIDLSARAVEHTRRRFDLSGFSSNVLVGDAERLPFPDGAFDIVYSWGVLHHSPDTPRAFAEVHRVLRPGGTARVMIYHKYSPVGYMLWLRYGLLRGRPFRSLDDIYYHHLESPGTKAFTVGEAQQMCRQFSQVDARSTISFGDLLQGDVGSRRHDGVLLALARRTYPRALVKAVFRQGLMLLIDAVK